MTKKEKEEFERLVGERANLLHENEDLRNEIVSLRRTVGGYITCVGKQKKEIADLKSALDLAKGQCDELSTKNKGLDEERDELVKTVKKLTESVNEQAKQKDDAKRQMEFYKARYEYYMNLPWYKKIF